MDIVKCPICDANVKLIGSSSCCHYCGFDFGSNRCSNPECRKPLRFNEMFCSCGFESVFYLDAIDITVTRIEKE